MTIDPTNMDAAGETVGSRRALLVGAGLTAGLGAMGLASPSAVAAPALKLDPANKKDQALIFRKLAYSLDDKVGFWWLQGRRFGLLDSELTPFWDMHVAAMFQTRDLPGGEEYEVTVLSVSFYTDVVTGQFIKQVMNPYTNKMIDISYYPPKPGKSRYNMAGRESTGPIPAGTTVTDTIGPTWIEGDQVWVQGDNLFKREPSAGKPRVRVNDLSTYVGSVRQVADPAVKSAASGWIFTDINTWPAWMQMGDQPGSYYSRNYGYKVHTFNEMPARIRALMAQEYPDVAKDPAGALKG